ncbi:amino acid permease [Lactobacillaceae bacterium Melli_B4]
MQMIALGGTIGVGLFMGASSTINWTGPSVLLDYAIAGIFLYLIMRALGEMLYVHPVTGAFSQFATLYMHPVFGFLTAWSNIFQWVLVGMSEVIAIGTYCNYWWPDLPGWVPGVIAIISLCLANLFSVKSFGELEYWFALIKVVTIVLMIIAGLGVIIFGFGHNMHPVGISNLWKYGFFTGGIKGFLFALAIVLGSYQGVELIGVTAGEADNPKKSIVEAIQSTIGRILIFYIGAIFVIVSVYPWDKIGTLGSPFVLTFSKLGITAAAGIINFVVLTAALSGSNSAIYSSSRMTYLLAKEGKLPKKFLELTKSGVPLYTVVAVSGGIFIGVILNVILPLFIKNASDIFVLVYSSSILPGMVPWFVILVSEMRFRKMHPEELEGHPFQMPFAPYSNYVTLFVLFITLIFMFINNDTRIPLIIGAVFLIVMTIIYFVKYNKTDLEERRKNNGKEVFDK